LWLKRFLIFVFLVFKNLKNGLDIFLVLEVDLRVFNWFLWSVIMDLYLVLTV
jgi:hypothetical protein